MLQPLVCRPPCRRRCRPVASAERSPTAILPVSLPTCRPASPTRLAKPCLVTSPLGECRVKEDFPPEPNREQDPSALNHSGTYSTVRLHGLYSDFVYAHCSLCASLLLAKMQASAKQRLRRLPTHRSPHRRLPTAHHR